MFPYNQKHITLVRRLFGGIEDGHMMPASSAGGDTVYSLVDIEFEPNDPPTITPAPEKLPHVITLEDTGGNRAFQRKLQENFDTIERQLLALDSDNQGNKDPNR